MKPWEAGRAHRVTLLWVLALVVVVAAALCGEETPTSEHIDDASAEASDGTADDGKLRVLSLTPIEAHRGTAVVVRYSGPAAGGEPVHVELAGRDAEILHRAEGQLVVRVPEDQSLGVAKVRVRQQSLRSKPQLLRVVSRATGKILQSLLGGIALFVFGLRTLARGLRGYAGHQTRSALARFTTDRGPSFVLGIVAGAIGQSIVSVAALALGLLRTRLLTLSAALVVLLGAHLGAGAAIFVLPFGVMREALWLVIGGVAVVLLARDRRSEAAGKVLLGLGLLFYGLDIVRTGLAPLAGDPDVLPYLQALGSDGLWGLLSRVLGGALLGAMLQGPGAVFGVVLSVGESTALFDQRQALEIVAATNIGASLGTVVLALPFGGTARRLALAHVGVGVASTAAFVALAGPSAAAAAMVLDSDPAALSYGQTVLAPNFGTHLALAYAIAQTAAVLLAVPLVRPILAAVLRVAPVRTPAIGNEPTDPERDPAVDPIDAIAPAIVTSLQCSGRMLDATLLLLTTGARESAATSESEIARARAQMKHAVAGLASSRSERAIAARRVCVAVLNVQQGLEQLQALAERGIEKIYRPDPLAADAFSRLHLLVHAAVSAQIRHCDGARPMALDDAIGREIELNAAEERCRERLVDGLIEAGDRQSEILWSLEVLAAYEMVGNRLHGLVEVVLSDRDDDF